MEYSTSLKIAAAMLSLSIGLLIGFLSNRR